MITARARQVADWFEVEPRQARHFEIDCPHPADPSPGQILLLTGPSGSGKSTLLRQLRGRYRRARWIDLETITLPRRPVVDVMADELGLGRDQPSIATALAELGRVGLGEVWTYLRTPEQLSNGQRWRLRLALALARAQRAEASPTTILAADEFASNLDPLTAWVVARAVHKAVSQPGLCAILATPRQDLAAALRPDVLIRCDFGETNIECSPES